MASPLISKAASALAQTLSLEDRLSLSAAVQEATDISQISSPWKDKIAQLILEKALYQKQELQKYNPNHGADGRFTSGGGGGGVVGEGDLLLRSFERKVDKVYATGTEDEFNIAHTGDQSTAALGQYLGKGSEINDNLRTSKTMAEAGYLDRGDGQPYTESDTVKGLDNAIEMAPPIGKQLVWRTTSADAIKGLKEGGVYMDKGYTSTTAADITHPDNGILLLSLATVSSGKKSIMEIETSKGKGLYMPRMFPGQPIAEHEKEFLMPRNTKMRYRGPEYRFLSKDQVIEVHRFKVVD